MTNLGEKIKRVRCSFLSPIPDEMKSYPDSLCKTHVESTDDYNLTEIGVSGRNANNFVTHIKFVIRKSL